MIYSKDDFDSNAALSENKVTHYDADHTGLYKLEIYFAFTELNN